MPSSARPVECESSFSVCRRRRLGRVETDKTYSVNPRHCLQVGTVNVDELRFWISGLYSYATRRTPVSPRVPVAVEQNES